jgi:hypothetical protein
VCVCVCDIHEHVYMLLCMHLKIQLCVWFKTITRCPQYIFFVFCPRYFFHSPLKRNVPTETCSFFSAKSSLTAVYCNNNRLLYSVMYTMERYCTSLYCIENPHWTRCLWRRVQYGFSIQYRRVLYISILYITLYNDLFIIQLKLSIL